MPVQIADDMEDTLKTSRGGMKRLSKKEKRRIWLEKCTDLELYIWGQGYRIAMKGLKIPPLPYFIPKDRRNEIINELSPVRDNTRSGKEPAGDILPFNMEELELAISKIKLHRDRTKSDLKR